MHFQRVYLHRAGGLAHQLVHRSMATDTARPRKRHKESATAAAPEVQWGHSFLLPGLTIRDLSMQVPLVHDQPEEGEQISIFARMVSQDSKTAKPLLLFLQGLFCPPRHSSSRIFESSPALPDPRNDATQASHSAHRRASVKDSHELLQAVPASSRLAHWTPAAGSKRRQKTLGLHSWLAPFPALL